MKKASQPDLIREERGEYKVTPEEEEKKKEWLEKLRLRLKDPEFRKTPGFPNASDEAILALSDPPYYTACPNPFLQEIVKQWQQQRPAKDGDIAYHRDPFAADVSEGKNDPIYNAHSYHTKVPHKAIMRYILHYTEPGDIVLDGFCGTGMTGVAAQLCGDKKTVESLGYEVDKDGKIFQPEEKKQGIETGKKKKKPTTEERQPFSRLGWRKAALIDLSPAATFIAYNYNTPVNAQLFEREAKRILAEVEKECGWMYETMHTDGKTKGKINYTVWSDVFLCPVCGTEMVFWDVAVNHEKDEIRDDWHCPKCKALLSKSPHKESRAQRAERVTNTRYDRVLGCATHMVKQSPVVINYSVGNNRYEKRPDTGDLELLANIEDGDIPYLFPIDAMMLKGEGWGDTWRAGYHMGITHVHHFYTHRNLWAVSTFWHYIADTKDYRVRTALFFLWQSLVLGYTKLNRFGATHYSQVNRVLSGTLYVASIMSEVSIQYAFSGKIRRLTNAFANHLLAHNNVALSGNSSDSIRLNNNTIDYIFVDPPFGGNLVYSELNFLWEAWLGVITNNESEAIINNTKRKGLPEYQTLMEACFREFYRILKPGHWMTVEFHNSQNAVWNSIVEALMRAGFMIADVRTLDKQQGTFKQVTTSSAVKQDLVISAYKPAAEFEREFTAENGSARGAWDFISQHLGHVAPPAIKTNGMIEFIEERAPYLLFDRMVAYHIQRGLSVPLSSPEFYAGLRERFAERDGMVFTFPQAAEYDRLRLQAERVEQLPLFITDEKTAIQWLRRLFDPEQGGGPQTYSDLANQFKKELHQVAYEAMPELRDMLEANFLQDAEERWYLPDPGKESDLQALREKGLLREFATYSQGKGRLKTFRAEAIRAGFSHAWKERQYNLIVEVAERLPARVFEDDPQLMMYADNARLRADALPHQENLF